MLNASVHCSFVPVSLAFLFFDFLSPKHGCSFRSMSGLNPPQQDAVDTLRGPLLVLAGAGTGKTRVVTFRIAKLIREGIKPDRILAVTFTNKAANEMQERIGELLGRNLKSKPQVSTFHSLCVKILRRHIRNLGYPAKFTICDRGDQESLARRVLRDIRVSGDTLRPGDLLAKISGWKSRCLRPPDALAVSDNDKDHLAAIAYRRYQASLKAAGGVDFDDLLLLTEDLFESCGEVREQEASLFDHLLVDEYQDTNGSQYRIVKGLAEGHRNLCVVGDDDQSIYGWRGAEVEHILRFARDWPDAKVVRLEDNYRSSGSIIEMANRLIVFNSKRHDKVLRASRGMGQKPQILQFPNETQEAAEVVAMIRRRLQDPAVEPRDIAILFRTNEQPRAFESELRKAKLPYVLIGGMSFFDRKEVRDTLAYLRLVDSDDDEVSLLRVINSPPRGVGQKAVERLIAKAVDEGVPAWHLVREPRRLPELPPAARKGLAHLLATIEEARRQAENGALSEMAMWLLDQVGYRQEIERLYPDANERDTRWDTVEQLINALAAHERDAKAASLTHFLDEVAIGGNDFGDEKEKQISGNAIVLMTLHSAKGLEFPEVFLVGLEEGILPHHRSVAAEGEAIDEERRLCYVGITRAQERLTLTLPLSRMKWGRPRDTIPSRFLFEIMGKAEHAAKYAKRAKKQITGRPWKKARKKG